MCVCVCVCGGGGGGKEQCFQFQSTPNGVSDSTCKVATGCYATPSWLVIGAKSTCTADQSVLSLGTYFKWLHNIVCV